MRRASPFLFLLVPLVVACRDNRVQQIPPTLAAETVAFDVGAVKIGTSATVAVPLGAANSADVVLTSVALEGSGAFAVEAAPERIAGLTVEPVTVRFSPLAESVETAELVVTSNDEVNPEIRLQLAGHGAHPRFALEVACDAATRCEATVSSAPPAVEFAPEAFVRLRPLEVPELPRLVFRSTGEVPLVLEALGLSGADLGAFSFVGNAALPDGGLTLAPGASASVPLRFRPTNDAQQRWAAQVDVRSDDPLAAQLAVPLTGALRPNQPPRVCVNVARVTSATGQVQDFDTPQGWAQGLGADGGVDYAPTRAVPPRAEVQLSALADADDEGACTADPEDGRLGLTWSWRLTSQPPGSTPVTLLNAASPRATLRPFATGTYAAELTVTDSQGNASSRALSFEVAVKTDLVVQLEWAGHPGVDLDLHLVRPSATSTSDAFAGAFAPFLEPDGGKVAGDVNGYATSSRADGGSFDWGAPGPLDDPQLNFDDTGSGPLVENVSLDRPENDERCAAAACTYRVFVHAFRDARAQASPPTCAVDGGPGCHDGEACGCAAGLACVAQTAPVGAGPSGPGRCLQVVSPVVRIFVRGSSTPAAVLPASGALELGAPCQLLHVADVEWPARGSDGGVVVSARTGAARFGQRSPGSLQCAPDGPQAGVPWYSQQPR